MSCGVTYSTGIVGRNIHLSGSGAVVEGILPPCFCKGIYFILLPSFCEKLEFSCSFFLVFFPPQLIEIMKCRKKCNFIILEHEDPWEFSSKLQVFAFVFIPSHSFCYFMYSPSLDTCLNKTFQACGLVQSLPRILLLL